MMVKRSPLSKRFNCLQCRVSDPSRHRGERSGEGRLSTSPLPPPDQETQNTHAHTHTVIIKHKNTFLPHLTQIQKANHSEELKTCTKTMRRQFFFNPLINVKHLSLPFSTESLLWIYSYDVCITDEQREPRVSNTSLIHILNNFPVCITTRDT